MLPRSNGRAKRILLRDELRKAVKAGRHAFRSGYRHAINEQRGRHYSEKAVDQFVKERYRLLGTFHPLASGGFISRIGHYNHLARRNDWRAVAKDITNLHLGGCGERRTFEDLFETLRFFNRYHNIITFEDKVGKFKWPDSLSSWPSVIWGITDALVNKGGLHISARRRGKNVLLDFNCGERPLLSNQDIETLDLAKQIVQHFGGRMETSKTTNGFNVSISLPYKIKVTDFYGGSHKKHFEARK